MSDYYTLRHTEEREGFTIKLYTTPELDEPDWDLTEEAHKLLLDDINDGILEWFIVKVTAEKLGTELSREYLGGCCYKSIEEFMQPGGCYQDMVDTVLQVARETIAELAE